MWRSEVNFAVSLFLLMSCGSWSLNSGCQICVARDFLTEPFCQPWALDFIICKMEEPGKMKLKSSRK